MIQTRLLLSIMLLQSKPQDLAYSVYVLKVILGLYVASGVFVLSRTTETNIALYSMALDVAVLSAFTMGCLAVLRLQARLVQTFLALFGTGAIYHMLAWPIIEQLNKTDLSDSTKASLSFAFLMLLSWQILVNAHIYRHALSVDLMKAVVLSIAYWLMSTTLSQILIPVSS